MKSKLTHPLFLIAFGVALFAILMNLSAAIGALGTLVGILYPIILGLLFAFVLNVPMNAFERLLGRLFARARSKSFIPALSLLLTLVCIALVIVLAFTLLIPTLVSSALTIRPLLEEKLPQWLAYLEQYQIDTTRITQWLQSFDITSHYNDLGDMLGSVFSGVRSTVSGAVSAVFGLVMAVYILLSKAMLGAQAKKLLYAYLKPRAADRICHIAGLIQSVFAKFLSGQTVEACVLGVLIFASFSAFGLPYAGLIGFLTGLFAFVPYIGAFASCAIGAFLILLARPEKVILSIAVYLVVQFVENQFIYPHVVGGSVGLSPLWTLIAALIGGNLFGLPGIIFFIPLTAVFYSLFREDVNRRLEQKAANK